LTAEKGGKKHMDVKEIFLLSFDALKERKARSALTILMVVVGSGLMIALNGISAGQNNFVNKQLNTLAPNVLFVSSGQRSFGQGDTAASITINSAVVDRIRSLPFVQEVVPAYQGQVSLESQGSFLNSPVLATDPQKIYLIDPSLQLTEGSTIKPTDPSSILVGDSIANPPGKTSAFLFVGETIKTTSNYVDPVTGAQKKESKSFMVSGIMQPTGNNQIDRAVIINTDAGNTLFHKSGKFDEMVVISQSATYADAVQQEITNLYGQNIGVITPKAILQIRERFINGNSSFILSVAFIALLVGAVGIITTLYTSVNERIAEIGTLKAIGAQKSFILSMFLVEALIIGLLGASLGLAVGISGSYVLSDFSGGRPGGGGGPGGGGSQVHIPPVFLPSDLLNVWILSLLLSIGAGLFPAWKASRLSPILALRR
jgi:putative ABC transport system permease protein